MLPRLTSPTNDIVRLRRRGCRRGACPSLVLLMSLQKLDEEALPIATLSPAERRRPLLGRLPRRGIAITLGIGGALFLFAYNRGGYPIADRNLAAVIVWWVLLVGSLTGVWTLRRVPRAALAGAALLAALTALTGISAVWAGSSERALNDFCGTLFYLGVYVLVVLAVARRDLGRWLDAVAVAAAATVVLGLISRYFPSLFAAEAELRSIPEAAGRLSFPVGYWNGLAVLAALGVPLLLRAALAARGPALRGLALAPLPAIAAAIYLASSRGGALASALAILVFLAATPRRAATLTALAVASGPTVAAIAVQKHYPLVVNGPFGTSAAASQGHAAAAWTAGLCALCGLAYAGIAIVADRRGRPVAVRVERGLLIALSVLVLAGVAAANPVARLHAFQQPYKAITGPNYVQSHLFSGNGGGRWQLWATATDALRTKPVLGRGAGSFEAWETQHGTLGFVRDAHSACMQTLAELGIVGLLVFVAFLITGLATTAVRFAGARREERCVLAALVAAFVAYVFAIGFDWFWQLPAVGVLGIVFLGLLTGRGTTAPPDPDSPSTRPPPAKPGPRIPSARHMAMGTMALVAVAAIFAEGLPLLSQLRLDASQTAARKGDLNRAVKEAIAARDLAPWAASPYLQVALLAERAGDLAQARNWITAATRQDPSDWRLWLVATRVQTEAGAIADARRSLARLRELNPSLQLAAS